MRTQHRWIKSENHLRKLKKVGEDDNYIGEQRVLFKILANRLREKVEEKMAEGTISPTYSIPPS
jgi:hypothetical protein